MRLVLIVQTVFSANVEALLEYHANGLGTNKIK